MAGSGRLVLRPWIRELILGSETLSSPRAGQLLEEAAAAGPSHAPDTSDVGATLLVSDGTHSVRCLVTREALDTSDWEEKEFGFRGTEGRLLLLQDCGVHVQVAEGGAPAEFYLQVDRFSLLPTEQPRLRVPGCNQDLDVQKKLYDCLEEHLSESTSSNAGLSLSQLLDEMREDQEHQGALVCLAESCLTLEGPCTAPPITHWAASRCKATGEAVYTVPSSMLCISENDQLILSSLGPCQRTQGWGDTWGPDPALQDLSLTLIASPPSSPSSSGESGSWAAQDAVKVPSSSGTPALPGHMSSEESGTSISLLPALSLAAPDPGQRSSSQPPPAICSAPAPLTPRSPHPSRTPSSPLQSCTPSLSPRSHVPSPHQALVTRPQKPSLEFKEFVGLPCKNRLPFPRTRATKGAQEPCSVWTPYPFQEPPKKHRDGSYEPPCTSLCARVQAARLSPQLMAWALHFLMDPQPESEPTPM
uniref:ACD shelterin complex subunit and telomerase recruitment factor n=1 Tax=Nomascus leucogenys TaxID=61853 RepID=A0A2I3HR23_NOMLE